MHTSLSKVDIITPQGRAWDIQPGEPGNWFMRFEAYRKLGTIRTVDAVYEAEKARAIKQGKYTMSAIPMLTTWKSHAKRFRWEDRAAAWDAEQVSIQRVQESELQQIVLRDAETDRVIQRQHRQELIETIYTPVLKYFKENPVAFASWKPAEQIQLLKLLLNENRTEYEALPGKEAMLKLMGKTNDELLQIIQGKTTDAD